MQITVLQQAKLSQWQLKEEILKCWRNRNGDEKSCSDSVFRQLEALKWLREQALLGITKLPPRRQQGVIRLVKMGCGEWVSFNASDPEYASWTELVLRWIFVENGCIFVITYIQILWESLLMVPTRHVVMEMFISPSVKAKCQEQGSWIQRMPIPSLPRWERKRKDLPRGLYRSILWLPNPRCHSTIEW